MKWSWVGPQMTMSVELLSFYHALFKQLCDTINALAATPSTYYGRQGFHMTNQKVGETMLLSICTTIC
ncbi:hypothetical protein EDC04DRAFT_2579061 [Pisolithus marmoratus]|nr:hypothetical protein EDC04DRAFT_2579061 [Pisolithus marmoratus]